MPAHWCNLLMRMEWSMVSNAALRSRNTNTEHAPESAAISKSFVTLRRAVSVLCNLRKPDWNFSKMWLLLSTCIKWSSTTFSRILEVKDSLEIGRKFFKSVGSKSGPFSSGWTQAVLNCSGTTPEVRELLMMDSSAGLIDSIESLNSFEAITSRGLDEGLISATVFLRSCSDIGRKQSSTTEEGQVRSTAEVGGMIFALIWSIFCMK